MKIRLTYILFCFIIINSGSAQKPELNIHSGHSAWIAHFAISPDEKYLATASYDNTVKLWDFRSGKEVRTLRGHDEYVECVAFSKDGNLIASGDDRGNILIWDISTGTMHQRIKKNHWQGITSLAFSNDNKKILSTGNDSLLRVSDINNGETLRRFVLDGKGYKVEFLQDDNRILSLDNTGQMVLWDVKGDSSLNAVYFRQGPINDFSLSPNGHDVFTTSNSDTNNVRIFDLDTWRIKKRFNGHSVQPSSVTRGNNDSTFFTASFIYHTSGEKKYETEIKKWNVSRAACIDSIKFERVLVHGYLIELSPKTNQVLTLTSSKTIAVLQSSPLSYSHTIKGGGTLINAVFETEPGSFVLFADDGPVKRLNLKTADYRVVGAGLGDKAVRKAFLSKDKKQAIILGYADSKIYSLDIKTQQLELLNKDSSQVRSFEMSNDQSRLLYYCTSASGGRFDKHSELVLKKTGNDSVLARKVFPTYMLIPYTLLQNNSTIAYQYANDTIDLLHTSVNSTSTYLTDPALHESPASRIFPVEDSGLLAVTQTGKLIKWNWVTGKRDTVVIAHQDSWIMNVDFNPDGSQFITSGNDQVVKLWDSRTLRLLQTFKGHESWITFAGFMDNGQNIYSTGGDYTLRVWDKKSGKEIASLIMVDTADLVTRLPNQFYSATKSATKFLSYRIGNELFPFEQFDLRFNRPQEVLKALGSADTAMIRAYSMAYSKRLKKSGFTESDFNEDIHLPVIDIIGADKIPAITSKRSVAIDIKATDTRYDLDRLYISVNNVPVNGTMGSSLRNRHIKMVQETVSIELSEGVNKIQVSCMNTKGVESLRKELYINYRPSLHKVPRVYFVGIGCSQFQNKAMDLHYADKDIRDLVNVFRSRYPGCEIDTFINKNATKEQILGVKKRLEKSGVDDLVIISISTHGVLDDKLDYYLATNDINFKDPSKRGLKYEELEDLLENIPARKKLLLIDACHSGEVDKEGEGIMLVDTTGEKLVEKEFAKGFRPTRKLGLQNSFELMKQLFADVSRSNGAVVISAAAGKEFALENDKWENGVFTYALKKGLVEGLADKNGNGISVNELKNYVSEQVEMLTNGRQRPTTRKENIEFDWNIW